MIPLDIGINFFTASISNFMSWDVGVIYITALALAGLIGSIFCEWCWRYGDPPKQKPPKHKNKKHQKGKKHNA